MSDSRFDIKAIMGDATTREERTEKFHNWLKNEAPDDVKIRYALNWRMPHSLFNVSCKHFESKDIRGIDWFKIFKSKDIGAWSHKGKVRTL